MDKEQFAAEMNHSRLEAKNLWHQLEEFLLRTDNLIADNQCMQRELELVRTQHMSGTCCTDEPKPLNNQQQQDIKREEDE